MSISEGEESSDWERQVKKEPQVNSNILATKEQEEEEKLFKELKEKKKYADVEELIRELEKYPKA